jgi:glycosyltransferase involved in cell wall biosynthesis
VPDSGKWIREINPGIIKEIWKEKYDAILIHGWNSFTSSLAYITAFLTKTPVFVHAENPLNQEAFKSQFKIKIKKFILGELFKRIKVSLYIDEENKKFFKYYGVPEEKLIFCPYAVENERFMTEAEKLKPHKNNFKKELGFKNEEFVILFMGKLIEKKRPLDLLKAYEILAANKPNSALIFVGDGVLKPNLEKYTADHKLSKVIFVGFKNQTELPKYYTLADTLVLPSGAGETWGLAVNEAMCFGLPVIVSDVVGCGPDLVKTNKNGFIFPLGNISQLAQGLAVLADNPQKRNDFGKESLKIVKNYNYEKDIAGILSALKLK